MDAARKFERLFFACPEVNCKDYDSFPILDENDYMGMCSDFCLHSSEICMFIFVRESAVHVPFVDIYVWDVTNIDEYDRFIICDGFRLPEDLEMKYLEYVHNKEIYISKFMFHEANKRIIASFPQWHYKDYRVSYKNVALQHLYFASHNSGAREILFKAEGLEYIAANLNKLPSYNIVGTTPSDIIDADMPLKLLRILDREENFNMLCNKSDCDMCKAAYKKYRGFIGKKVPSVGQWNYILELYKNGGKFGGYGFKREIYDKASNFYHQDEIDAYKKYFSIRKALGIPGKLIIPDFEEIWGELEHMETLAKYKEGIPRIDRKYLARKSYSFRYEYSNKEYMIIMPTCSYDVCVEALYQHNCVTDYIHDHADEETTILFLRRRSAPEVPFVTMEVGLDFEIKQIYGKCNSLPQKDVYEFIVEYSKARVLSYDLDELIIANLGKIDEADSVHRKELIEFAMLNRCSTNSVSNEQQVSSDETEYYQICFDDIFDEFFEGL